LFHLNGGVDVVVLIADGHVEVARGRRRVVTLVQPDPAHGSLELGKRANVCKATEEEEEEKQILISIRTVIDRIFVCRAMYYIGLIQTQNGSFG
jgi:hypothetical protein